MTPERNEFVVNGCVFAEERTPQPGGFARVVFTIDGALVRECEWYAAILAARRAEKEAGR